MKIWEAVDKEVLQCKREEVINIIPNSVSMLLLRSHNKTTANECNEIKSPTKKYTFKVKLLKVK